MRYYQNEANLIGSKMLESFDEDNGDRKKAMQLLYENVRPSEFIEEIKPIKWPQVYPHWDLWERIPEYTRQWAYFKTKTLKDDFRKMEALIDYIRRRYNLLARKERIARRYFELNEEMRDKYRDRVNGFYNFGKIGKKLRAR